MCGYMPLVCSACGGQKRAWNPLELELKIVMVRVEDGWYGELNQVLCKNKKCSQLVSHLPAPGNSLLNIFIHFLKLFFSNIACVFEWECAVVHV